MTAPLTPAMQEFIFWLDRRTIKADNRLVNIMKAWNMEHKHIPAPWERQ